MPVFIPLFVLFIFTKAWIKKKSELHLPLHRE